MPAPDGVGPSGAAERPDAGVITAAEVAAPPAMRPGGYLDPHACSLIGCDLGPWYRIGWAPTAPFTQPAPTTAPPAPHIDRVSTPALACHATGEYIKS